MSREREHDRERPVMVVERSESGLGPFFLGALIGAGVALLLAPRSGAETRRLLRQRSREMLDAAGRKADEFRGLVEEGYERGRERVEEGLEHVRRSVEDRREAARDTVDAGRAAVQSARDELERRLSEARSARRAARTPTPDDIADD
ncbi:MAG TPA: YtxH domain-containing protein [Gemmatimonadales bacterium]|nr:YtxH domain-containing protein [Gemmatimonadales bacterium]